MQRRDARSFLEDVLSQIPDLDPKMRAELLGLVDDKPGTKRAAKLAAVLAAETAETDENDESESS